MKNYTITVNGVAYEVTVEEGAGGAAAAMPAMPKAPAATAPMPAAPAAAPAASAGAGANRIEAGAPGCQQGRYSHHPRGHEDGDPHGFPC